MIAEERKPGGFLHIVTFYESQCRFIWKRVGKLEFDQKCVINNAILDNLINPRKLLIMQYLSECPITSFEFLLCISYAW